MEGLTDASLETIPVHRGMKCIYCRKYRPKEGFRCYGFIDEDLPECIDSEYQFFKPRFNTTSRR